MYYFRQHRYMIKSENIVLRKHAHFNFFFLCDVLIHTYPRILLSHYEIPVSKKRELHSHSGQRILRKKNVSAVFLY